MKFKEITDARDIYLLLSIVATYKTTEELKSSRKNILKELSEAGDNRLIFIGLKDDINVAMVQIILKNADNDPDYANGKDIAHVHNLQVRKELQGQGLGQEMMAFLEEKAKQIGKKILTLGVDDWNKRALNFYKKRGYIVFKEEPGQFADERCLGMRKSL